MSFTKWLGESIRRARMLGSHRERFDREMEEEMRLHRDLREREARAHGATAPDAHHAVQRRFGNTLRIREEIHEAWGWTWIDNLGQDLRYGLRLLRKSPVFTVVVVVTLGLGIGANTAIFSAVYAVLLRSLPYAHPEELVSVLENNPQQGVQVAGCSYQDFLELQQSGVFTGAAGATRHDLTLTGSGDPTTVTTVGVTPEIFPLLNANPLAGRYFLPADGITGAAPVVLLSEALWRARFGADPHRLGQSIRLDQQAFTIVGIMPDSFRVPVFGSHQEIWIPIIQDPLFGAWIQRRGLHWLPLVGRLPAGVSLASAQSAVDAISRRLAAEYPAEDGGWRVRLTPLQTAIIGDIRTPLLVLLGAVGLVLLLACVNVANLLLARATTRAREVALRHALGAERGRLIRQLLTESAALGLLGAILGVALAYCGAHALSLLLPPDAPTTQKVQIDGWVLGFALLLSMAASVGFGLAPALLAANSGVQSSLKDSASRSGSDRGRLRVRSLLTRVEIALAMVLVAGAGLLVRSLVSMTAVNPGSHAAHLLKAEISLPRYEYSTPQQWTAFSDTFLERVHAQPGLQDSALAVPLPLADRGAPLRFSIVDHAAMPASAPQTADHVSVSPAYFRVMGIPLLQGRSFTAQDSDSEPAVVIIDESFVQAYFPHENPLGKRLVFGSPLFPNVAREIVGVVGSVRDAGLAEEPGPMMYAPFAQAPFWGAELVVKTLLPTQAVVGEIHQVVRSIDENLPVTGVATMPDVLDDSVAQPRLRAWLVGAFGVVALLLAAGGVFGVVSYSVASRTREFGVRAALGAPPASIRKMILLEGLSLAGAGLGLGLAAALVLARFLKSELYGVTAYDSITLLTSAGILMAAALVACYIPARRATRVDPILALRCE